MSKNLSECKELKNAYSKTSKPALFYTMKNTDQYDFPTPSILYMVNIHYIQAHLIAIVYIDRQ